MRFCMSLGLSLVVLFSGFFTYANNSDYCSYWQKENSYSCHFGKSSLTGQVWVRECENPCVRRYPFHPPNQDSCNYEEICMPSEREARRKNLPWNPNHLDTSCTPWTKVDLIRCQTDDNRLGSQWVRSCQRNLPEEVCSQGVPQ